MKNKTTGVDPGSGLEVRQLEDIFENALECISRIDRQGNFLSINSRYAESCGYTVEEMIGMVWEDTVVGDDLVVARQAFQAMIDTGRGEAELRGVRKNGQMFFMHIVLVRGLETTDSSVGHYCFMQDITHKKLAEKQVLVDAHRDARYSEEKFTRLLTSSPDAVFILHFDSQKITYLNDAALALSGYRAEEMLGQPLPELDLFSLPYDESGNILTLLGSDSYRDRDALIRHSSGNRIPISLSLTTVNVEGRNSYQLVARDISQRKLRERAYKQATELLSTLPAENFFQNAVKLLADTLDVEVAMITACEGEPEGVVRTLAFCESGKLQENTSYPLDGTPCAEVLGGQSLLHTDGIQSLYPRDSYLSGRQLRSYLAEPMRDSHNRIMGHFAILDTRPVQHIEQIHSLLKVFSARAAVELERKQSLRDLQVNEERLQQVTTSSQAIIWEVDKNLVYTFVSPAVEEVLGYRPEEIIGTRVVDILYPQDKREFLCKSRDYIKSAQPFSHICARMFHKNGRLAHFRVSGMPILDKDGNLQSVRGSSIDITNEIQVHRELLEHEEYTRLILEHSLDAYIAIDETGIVKQWNKQSEALLGWGADEAIGTQLTELIIPFHQHEAHKQGLNNYLSTGQHNILNRRVRLKARHRHGHDIPVELSVIPIDTAQGKMFSAFIRDLREELRHEKLEQVKLKLLEKIAKTQDSTAILGLLCKKIQTLYSSDIWLGIAVINSGSLQLLAATSQDQCLAGTLEAATVSAQSGSPAGVAAATGRPVYLENIRSSTTYADLKGLPETSGHQSCWSQPFSDESGQIIGCLMLYRASPGLPGSFDHRILDEAGYLVSIVLEREQQRRQLAEIRDKYSKAIDISPEGIAITSVNDDRIIDVNEGFCKISGYPREELIGASVSNLLFDSPEERQALVEQVVKAGFIRGLERKARTRDGRQIYWLQSSVVTEIDGEKCLFSIGQDITLRKREEQLQTCRNKILEAITTSQPLERVLELIVTSAEEIEPGMLCSILLLDSAGKRFSQCIAPSLPEFYNRALIDLEIGEGVGSCGTSAYTGKRIIVADVENHPYWTDYKDLARRAGLRACWSHPIFSSDKKVLGTFAIYYHDVRTPDEFDIEFIKTQAYLASISFERERHVRILQNREETLRKYFDTATEAIVITRYKDGIILKVNKGFEQISGFQGTEVIGENIIDLSLWTEPEQPEEIKQLLDRDGQIQNREYTFRVHDDRIRRVLLSATLFNLDGEQCVMATSRDITEWRETQEALRSSEEKFRDAFGKAPIGILLINKDGVILQSNKTINDIMGYSTEEMCTGGFFDLMHPASIETCHAEFVKLFHGVISELKLEKLMVTADNTVIWVEIHASAVLNDRGQFLFAVIHIIDITERTLESQRFSRAKRALQVLNDCNHGFSQINEEINLLQYICEVIVTTGLYRMSWVGYLRNKNEKVIEPIAYAGHESGYLDKVLMWQDQPSECGPTVTCIRNLQPCNSRDIKNDDSFGDRKQDALQRGYASCCAIPFLIDNKITGALTLYSSDVDAFDAEEVSLLQDLTANMSRSLQNIRIKHKHELAQAELQASEEKFRLAFDNASVAMALVNDHGLIIDVNNTGHEMLGYERSELVGKSLKFITHPDDIEMSLEYFRRLYNGEIEQYQIQKRYIRKDNRVVYAVLNASLIPDESGKPGILVAIIEDITLRRKAEIALLDSEERYRRLYDDTPSMFFTVNEEGFINSVNEYGASELGYDVQDLIDEPLDILIHPDDRDVIKGHFSTFINNPDIIQRLEFRKIKKDGTVIWVRETLRCHRDTDDSHRYLIVCEDISEIQRLSSQLSWQATHDALTGLVNRTEFERRLERVLQSSFRTADDHALCFLDMDQFKVINDTCGHLAGDELLRQLSEVLTAAVRKRDTLARLGGDEFGILMEHCDMDKAREVAESVLKKVEDFRFTWENKRFSLGVSIGLVSISGTASTVTSVMREADAACYAAKDAGRNRVHVYQAGDKKLSRIRGEMQWVSIINEAIEDDKILLYKQEIRPLGRPEHEGMHYELLIRLKADDGQIILPGAFMPAAERYNLTTKIDAWVVRTYLAWLYEHPVHLEKLSLCTINLSGLSMSDMKFIDMVLDLFEYYNIPGEKIGFEITETAAIQNMSNAIKFMNLLKGIGCRFALDDFGSGVSSFAYLKQIPVEYIKIDGSFVRDIQHDRIDFEMVRSISDIARVMGIQAIAEFVESEEILSILHDLGVSYGQGFAIQKPVPLVD